MPKSKYPHQIDSAATKIGSSVIADGCSPEWAAQAVSNYYTAKGISVEMKSQNALLMCLPSTWCHTRGYDPDKIPSTRWANPVA